MQCCCSNPGSVSVWFNFFYFLCLSSVFWNLQLVVADGHSYWDRFWLCWRFLSVLFFSPLITCLLSRIEKLYPIRIVNWKWLYCLITWMNLIICIWHGIFLEDLLNHIFILKFLEKVFVVDWCCKSEQSWLIGAVFGKYLKEVISVSLLLLFLNMNEGKRKKTCCIHLHIYEYMQTHICLPLKTHASNKLSRQ